MSISERDWKKFKVLRALALERFHKRVLADAKSVSEKEALSPADRYHTLYRLVMGRDKDIVNIFDHYSRSSAYSSLAWMVAFDLLTDDELAVLSQETLAAFSYAVRRSHEIEWVELPPSQD